MPRLVRKQLAVVLFAISVGLTATAVAVAANPVRSATYRGKARGYSVSFKVSADGKQVKKLKVPLPAQCQYGGIASLKPTTAKVSRGKFKASMKFFALNGQPVGTVTVTGTFLPKGKENGAITSHWAQTPTGTVCSATWHYATTA